MYYKLGQICFIINQGKRCYKLRQLRYYKLGQVLLQIGAAITNYGNRYSKIAAITNWGKTYYKLGYVLQIRAIITNWGIAAITKKTLMYITKQFEKYLSQKCRMNKINPRALK